MRLACLALLVAALTLAGCGGGDDGDGDGATTPPTTDARYDGALWPDPAVADEATSPRAVARSFIVRFVGMPNPALGTFQQGDAQSGEVPVLRRAEDGSVIADQVIATVAVRRLDGKRWFVIAALSDDVEIRIPAASAAIASPARVSGVAAGFEGNVDVTVHAAYERAPLAEEVAIAGTTQPEPFSVRLSFQRPPSATGALVARTGGGLDTTDPFAALPVRFAGG